MNQIDISCPSCGFSRQVPSDRVPQGSCRVTCPRCRTAFTFSRTAESPPPSEPEQTGGMQEPVMQTPPQPPQPAPEPPLPAAGLEPQPESGPERPPRPRRERPAPPRRLPDIGTLFNRSWTIFQQRFATLIGLYLTTMAAFIIPPALLLGAAILAGAAKGGTWFVLLGAVGALAGFYAGFVCFGAFLQAVVDDKLAFRDALAKGKSIAIPLAWAGFLTGFIIAGGFMLFIIPGIIFTIWFFFAQFIVVSEGLRGMGSLLKSKEYVRGEWFNVALRLLLVWSASMLLGIVPVVGPILSIVFLPYVIIFHYLLYRDLAELKGDIPYSCGSGDLVKWPATALAGYILLPTILLLLLGSAVKEKFNQLSAAGVSITLPGAASPTGSSDGQGYRVIDFPANLPAQSPAASPDGSQPPEAAATGQSQPAKTDETPENIHVFIYSVNYTGSVRANDVTLKEIEGKPEVQYNYNLGGTGLRYGENRIDLDYSELPAHSDSLLQVHIRISRSMPGKAREVLGEWYVKEKGSGRKSFTLEIPRT